MKRAYRRELQRLAKSTTSIEFAELLDKCQPGSRELAYLVAMMQHYLKAMQKTVGHQPEGFAAGLHELVDRNVARTIKENQHGPVSCGKGCSHCCKLPMHILKAEAKLIVNHCAENGIPVDVARLRRQKGYNLRNWGKLSIEDRACAFLAEDGSCSIYEVRPSVCRKYNVLNPPEHCDTIRFYGHETARLASPDAEAAVSAAMNYHPHGPMADMMLEALDEIH